MRFLVVDPSGCIEHALRLAKDGNDVLYHVPWQGSYPTYAGYAPGEGFEGLTKVHDLGKSLDEADIIMFTDIGHGPLASYLRRHGYAVFGAGDAEILEFDRANAIERVQAVGVKTPPTKVVVGVDAALRAIKEANGPRIVKLNIFRGDSETMHVPDYGAAQAMLNWMRGRLGPFDEDFVFLIQEPIEGVMVGVDTFFDGERFSSPRGFGIEISADVVEKWEDASLFDGILEKVKPMLNGMGYRGALSIEAMYDGKDLYVIDWTCRFPLPLSIMYTDCIQNYSEVIAGVAKGKMPQLKITKPYTALLSLQAFGVDRVTEPWLPIRAEEGVKLKLRRAVKRGGQVYSVPGVEGESAVAAVYGEGDTWKEAIEQAAKGRGEVNIHNSYYYGEFGDSVAEQVKALAEKGVSF